LAARSPDVTVVGMADKPSAPDAAKDRFREALERKRSQQHPTGAGGREESKIHGAHEKAAGGKRQFRRKAGG
jgi:hypothetical protein